MMTTNASFVQNYTTDVYEAVKCEICLLTFRTSAERNTHILNHFQQLPCLICQQNLIRIGDTWYGEHSDHVIPKTEPNTNEYTTEAVILSDYIPIKSNDEPYGSCIQNGSNSTVSNEIDPIFSETYAPQAEENIMDLNGLENTFARANEFQPEQIMIPEFIEHKPQEIIHNEFIVQNEFNAHVDANFTDSTAEDTIPMNIQGDQCPICNKIIKCKTSLKYHMNIHRGIKPYECASCDCAFADKRNLVQHAKKQNHMMKISTLVTPRKIFRKANRQNATILTTQTQSSNSFQFANNDGSEHTIGSDEHAVPKREDENSQMECEFNVDNNFPDRAAKDVNPEKIDGDECPICNKIIKCKTSMKYHMNIHKGIKPFSCNECGSSFADKRNLVKHLKYSNHTMKINNLETPETFSGNSKESDPKNLINTQTQSDNITQLENDLAEHPITHYSDDESAVSSIVKRNDENSQMDNSLADRITEGTIPMKFQGDQGDECPICNKIIKCKTSRKYHMNIHKGIKPFKCDECGKSFADKRNMNEHKKTHLPPNANIDLNDYNEIDCVEIVLTKEQLVKKECPICMMKFTHRKALKRHVKIHEGRRYQCKICDKSFHDVRYYRRHRKIVHANVASSETVEKEEFSIQGYENDVSTSIDWMCEYCNEDFELEIRLARHIMKEHNEERQEHPCNICNEKFVKPHDLLTHMRFHSESYQYKCTYDGCGHGFAFKSSLGVHINKHNRLNKPIERKTQDHLTETTKKELNNKDPGEDGMVFACDICDKKFTSRTAVSIHMQGVHTNKRLRCPVDECDKIFKTTAGVSIHIKTIHPETMKACEICEKTFCTDKQLAKHRTLHDTSMKTLFACSICDKNFTTKHRLRDHLGQHEKDVTCNICGEKFANVRKMVLHRERHGKKPILTCRFKNCNQVFEDRREFMRHASTHPDDEKKKFICNYCGKGMCSMTALREHINSHTGERPYKCSECDKRFGKNSSLYRHLQIHTGKKPYICTIEGCQKAYRDSIDLKRHKFSAHKIYTKKHTCPICSKVFPERKLLTKHTISLHGKIDSATTSQSN